MYGGSSSGYGGYGGYGSSMGSYGGYGGYSSYGGMGSYGSLGSYGGMNRTTMVNGQNSNQTNTQDPNNPNKPPQQQVNQRRLVFQQYFKMMGGLRSMVQLGFSMVALCNFTSQSWQLLKKIMMFLTRTSRKLVNKLAGSHFLADKMSIAFQKAMMLSPNSKNGNTILNKFLVALRISAALILMVGIKLKSNLNNDIQNQHDEILKKYQQIKLEQEKIKQKDIQIFSYDQQYGHQKQGYF